MKIMEIMEIMEIKIYEDEFYTSYYYRGRYPIHCIFHRMDGPALIGKNGTKEFWIHGNHLTEEEYWKEIDKIKRFGDFI